MYRKTKQLIFAGSRQDLMLWFSWVLVTTLSSAGGWFVSAILGYGTLLLGLIAAGSIVGACVGYAQSWVLKRYGLPIARFIFADGWVIASIIGWSLAWFVLIVGVIIGSSMIPHLPVQLSLMIILLEGAVPVITLSSVQWWYLRRYTRASVWWIPINLVGWGIGIYLAVISTMDLGGHVPVGEASIADDYWVFFLAATIVTSIASAINGILIVWIMRNHYKLIKPDRPDRAPMGML